MSISAFTFTSPDNLIINVSAAEQVQDGQSGLLFDFDVVQPDPANPIRIDLNGFFWTSAVVAAVLPTLPAAQQTT
jgi:hypothetical protein